MPSRSTGSTSSRYIFRSVASVSPQSWPERIRQRLSCGMTRIRAPSRMTLGAAGWRHLVGLGQAECDRACRPNRHAPDFAAHALGKHRDAFRPSQRREQGFVALDRWTQHLDERAEPVGFAARRSSRRAPRKPAVELCAIVPIGNCHDIGEAGFVDIAGAVPMGGADPSLEVAFRSMRVPARRLPKARLGSACRNRPSPPGRRSACAGRQKPDKAARNRRRRACDGYARSSDVRDRGFHGGLLVAPDPFNRALRPTFDFVRDTASTGT